MPQKCNVSLAGIAGLLLLLCGAVRANEADDTIHRLAAQAREQARAGNPEGLADTLREIAKALPDAGPDGVSAVGELNAYLADPGIAGPGRGTSRATAPESGDSPPSADRRLDPPRPAVPAAPAPPMPSEPVLAEPAPAPAPAGIPEAGVPESGVPESGEPPRPVQDSPARRPAVPAAGFAPPTPVPATPPAAPVEASRGADALLALLRHQGDAALGTGDVSGARRFYRRGAEAGCGACAEALARTYDAEHLRRMGAVGPRPDPAQAEAWRARARQLGWTDAP